MSRRATPKDWLKKAKLLMENGFYRWPAGKNIHFSPGGGIPFGTIKFLDPVDLEIADLLAERRMLIKALEYYAALDDKSPKVKLPSGCVIPVAKSVLMKIKALKTA